jgi:hypothetical protein
MQKTPYVFPIIGCSNVEALRQNMEGLKISLSSEQIQFIENEGPKFDPGFPSSLIVCILPFPFEKLLIKSGLHFRVTVARLVGWCIWEVKLKG